MELKKELRRYMKSGVGVIAVRTRDPMAVMSEVAELCAGESRSVKFWDFVRGWIAGDDPVAGPSAGDVPSKDPMTALMKSIDEKASEAEFPKDMVLAYINLHMALKKGATHPAVIQQLSNMAYLLPTMKRRVVLTIPTGFSFPPELIELIPVIDALPPNVVELQDATDLVMDDYRKLKERSVPRLDPEDLKRIAQAGVGMIMPEFEASLSRVVGRFLDQNQKVEPEQVRMAMLREKADMVKRNRALEVMSSVSLDEVGGLDRLKEWVGTRAGAMRPEAWEAGVSKPKGCALVGPPGTGKSLLGKVIGSVLGVATIRFDLSAVFSGLVGSSEENLREALFLIESLAPCVVLLDEVDKALNVNSGGDGGTSQKVLGGLLTFMQETKAPIFWVPTLNRTQNVPAEFMRAGRIDQVFGVSTPNVKEREEILRIHLRLRKQDPDTVEGIREIAAQTEDYVGAELEAIVSEARLLAYNEGVNVTYAHLTTAKDGIKPLSSRMKDQFDAMQQWCKDNAIPASRSLSEAVIPTTKATPRRRQRTLN